jgi:hypothetical protein
MGRLRTGRELDALAAVASTLVAARVDGLSGRPRVVVGGADRKRG